MNDIELTKEQRERLAPWERHLHTAFYADYVVALSTGAARDLFGVYNEIYKAHEANMYCSACVLNVCKKLGRLFFAAQGAEKTEDKQTPAEPKKTPAKGKKGGKNGKK